ncbi:hypothetical protein [Pseudomonas tolaasii]|uniref:hypothetical protein n=1 Tax=Pseudomonas tolaasii TaxID=29442 RepID=UPI000C1FAB2B|nr:hypothetical protein [Pseudomonas tolaasii]
MESQQRPAKSAFWSNVKKLALVVPIAAMVGAGLSQLLLGGIDYGELRGSLKTANTRNESLEKSLDEFRRANEEWRNAYTKLNSDLSNANARVINMQNDQCESIRGDISSLQYKIENAYGYGDTEEKRSNLQIIMKQHQESLRACFASRK